MKKIIMFAASSFIIFGINGVSHACFYNENVKNVKAHGSGHINFTLSNNKYYELMDNAKTEGGRAEYKLLLLSMATGMKISGATDSQDDCNKDRIKSLTLEAGQ